MPVDFDAKLTELAAEILRDAVKLYDQGAEPTPVAEAWNTGMLSGLNATGSFAVPTGSFMALTQSEGETKLASSETLHEAELHVKNLLAENYAATTAMVTGARTALDAIARDLIDHETISGDRVRDTISVARQAA